MSVLRTSVGHAICVALPHSLVVFGASTNDDATTAGTGQSRNMPAAAPKEVVDSYRSLGLLRPPAAELARQSPSGLAGTSSRLSQKASDQ